MTKRWIEMTASQIRQLINAASKASPNEICGLLAGNAATVQEIIPIRNISAEPARSFVMEPQGFIEAYYTLEARGWQIVGMYHSHPSGSLAAPSIGDAYAAYPGCVLLIIVPPKNGHGGAVRAFDRDGSNVAPVELDIVNTD